MKPVVFWDAKRVPQRDKSGNPIADKYTGVFATKVAAGMPGAFRYSGTLANGREYDFHQKEVTSVRGQLRWIDKQGSDYGTNLILVFETEKAAHRISIPYDVVALRQVVNHLAGLKGAVADAYINVNYWVREATDASGKIKTNDQGKVRWASSLMFQDIAPDIPFSEYREFAQKHGLEWVQKKNAKGETEWDQSAEYKYWDSRLVALQRFLLKTPGVLPFTYNSLTACQAENPSGGGNLTDAEIELCKEIYTRVKSGYRFPFQREEIDADSILDEYVPPQPAQDAPDWPQQPPATIDEPDYFPPVAAPAAPQPVEVDDLPF